jgi:TRAP-type C4-dicarboxylate transport system substrate-binding protein
MKGKKVVSLFLIGFVVFLLGSASLFQEAWGAQDNIRQMRNGKMVYLCKMGTLAPDGVGWAALIKEMINPGVLKVTNGEVVLDWYYGGTMGDDLDILAKMRNGQLQGGGFTGWGVVMGCPEMALMELPFLFNNYDEIEYVYSKIRPRISQWYHKRGYHILVLAEQDFDQMYSTKHEIRTPDDFKKSRFLTWYGPLEERSLKALGASPLPIRVPEVAASIRTGVCDAFISPALWAVGTQMYTVMKHVNPLRIRYSPAAGIVSNQAWAKLPKEHQVAIDNFALSVEKEFRQKVRASNEKCLNSMIKYGMKETKMTPADIEVFRKRLIPVWEEFAGKFYSKAELEEVKGFLAEYRAKNKK